MASENFLKPPGVYGKGSDSNASASLAPVDPCPSLQSTYASDVDPQHVPSTWSGDIRAHSQSYIAPHVAWCLCTRRCNWIFSIPTDFPLTCFTSAFCPAPASVMDWIF
ncbi:unnamed protein product [Allacma fusca]|uniref:Uncharacterized protein n=1 Tax=Allacma fusca TaxID=39272 RepID=A0A8J2LCC7_9HEXA|nr:unnamed protein product [Allacma fusca]